MAVEEKSTSKAEDSFLRQWHHRPATPIQVSPLFNWPPAFAKLPRWIADRWLNLAENSIIVVIACVCWLWFQPSIEETKTLSFGWVAQIYIRNFVLLLIVAGALHLFFYSRRAQRDQLKFDNRELKYSSKAFTFNNQVLDNMFWSLGSGVAIWSSYEVLMFWAMANGYAPMLGLYTNPLWFVALFFLTPLWISFHFYWIHRLIHWPPLYKHVHALHHRNTNVGPWSGLSMHPLEHLLFFSSILIHWLVAAHPIHILFHMQHQALTAATSHSGYEALLINDKKRLALGTFHHQMHHRYFTCNFGNLEVPLDKWFGTFHNGSVESHSAFMDSRRS